MDKLSSKNEEIREKWIIYQTLVMIFVKFFCFPFCYFSYVQILADEERLDLNMILNAIYYPLFIIDMLTTPIVFQITYVLCDKSNLEILLKMKMNFRTWRMIFCGSSNHVENHKELYNMSN
ncbi:unnamed protein product [Caenorhabditis angaria]|uniref:Uncharacterized protein n=1 Tax=Caenorhabditis angaria TaxID=860376 RepID=A0A9P1ITY7_9PELO|nr:unnamed protein product [Caenorhabditis angaria]